MERSESQSSLERREQLKREAVAELDRMGFASLRKARQQTQAELADKLGIDQASVSAIENRSNLLLSTLAKYVRALGGDVEIRAVFSGSDVQPRTALDGRDCADASVRLHLIQTSRYRPEVVGRTPQGCGCG